MSRWFRKPLRRHPVNPRAQARLRVTSLEERTVPANLLVTTTADSGLGSLRQALSDAANPSRPGLDTITFDPSVTGMITLGSPLMVNSDVMIVGPGANVLSVSGNKIVHVFDVNDGAATTLSATISGLTIRDGATAGAGAGISLGQNDQLTLQGVHMTGNTAMVRGGAIDASSDGAGLTIIGSTLSGNSAGGMGGAVYFWGQAAGNSINIRNTTISGNTAPQGGGFALANFTGDLLLCNSTVVQNKANVGTGGGILRTSGTGTVSLVSTILQGNSTSAGSGPDASTAGTLNYNHSLVGNKSGITTLVDQGGNLAIGTNPFLGALGANGGTIPTHAVLLGSPVIDKGMNPAVAQMYDARGVGHTRSFGTTDIGAFEYATAGIPTVSGTFANVGMSGSPTYTFQLTFADDYMISVATLASGQDVSVAGPNGFTTWATYQGVDTNTNGTPRIATYSFVPPGGAWDAADNGTYTITLTKNAVYDYSANAVPAGDIGQFSVSASSGSIIVTNDLDSGAGSLRAALAMANASPGTHDVITFDPTFFNVARTITLATGELAITDPVTIQGPGTSLLTVSGNSASRIFNVNNGVAGPIDVTISDMALASGMVNSPGGAITIADEVANLSNLSFTSNRTTSTGANAGGGAIAMTGAGSLYVFNSTFTNNKTTGAGADGGAIRAVDGSQLTIDTCYMTGNVAAGDGGAVYVSGASTPSSLVVLSSTMSNNNANDLSGDGGAIFFFGTVGAGGFVVRNSTLSGNAAVAYGGAVGINSLVGTALFQNSTITDNSAGSSSRGGGVSQLGGTGSMSFESTVVSGNFNSLAPDVYTTGKATFATSALGSKTGIFNYQDAGNNLPIGTALGLGALGMNGGTMPTHLPNSGSVLIDRGSNPAGLGTDQRGNSRQNGVQVDIGSVEAVSPGAPIAQGGPFANIDNGYGNFANPYTFTITYQDETAVMAASFDNADIRVTGPNGYNVLATFVNANLPGDGSPRIVTYSIPAPGGTWDGFDAGQYTIALEPNQVTDIDSHAAAAITFGGFKVDLSRTYIVTNNNDAGAGSLREAIAGANLTTSPDTITFDPAFFNVPRTITLATGELTIAAPVDVQGPGMAKLTITGNSSGRVFNINDGTTAVQMSVTLSDMKITGGKSSTEGGGIYLFGDSLSIVRTEITGNSSTTGSGGGIFIASKFASLSVTDSVISKNSAGLNMSGGGIRVDAAASVSIVRSTISGNVAPYRGGGIYFNNGGSLLLTESTVSGNTASSKDGGGLYFFGAIGSGGITVQNSTFSGNWAYGNGGGAAFVSVSGTPTIHGSTFTQNVAQNGTGGGIARTAGTNTFNLVSSIVANNSAASTLPDLAFNAMTAVNGGNDLIGVADGTNFSLTGSGNLTGAFGSALDPMLGGLAANGGPTMTHKPLTGSPAINAGSNPAASVFDQRGTGFLRVSGGQADIGAVEVQVPPTVAGSVVVNDGATQRSQVTSLTVTFSTLVNFLGGNPAPAFVLEKMDGVNPIATVSVVVDLSASTATQTVARLTFVGAGVETNGSLMDGRYRLTILAANVTDYGAQQLDGNGDQTPGDNFTTGATITRLFGDVSGDGFTDNVDLIAFRAANGSDSTTGNWNAALDANGDGFIDNADFIAFRQRIGVVI